MSHMSVELLLASALGSAHGIEVVTNNPDRLRQKLYKVKRESVEYACLSFVIPKNDPESLLWIVRKEENTNAQD